MAAETNTKAKPQKLGKKDVLWHSAMETIRAVVKRDWWRGKSADGEYSHVYITTTQGEIKLFKAIGYVRVYYPKYANKQTRQPLNLWHQEVGKAVTPNEPSTLEFYPNDEGEYLTHFDRDEQPDIDYLVNNMGINIRHWGYDGAWVRLNEVDEAQIDTLLATGFERASYTGLTACGYDQLDQTIEKVTAKMWAEYEDWFERASYGPFFMKQIGIIDDPFERVAMRCDTITPETFERFRFKGTIPAATYVVEYDERLRRTGSYREPILFAICEMLSRALAAGKDLTGVGHTHEFPRDIIDTLELEHGTFIAVYYGNTIRVVDLITVKRA